MRVASSRRSERGETTTQTVIMIPALMLLVLLGVQAALWYHAANVAQVAAARGASAGSSKGAGESAATQEARAVVADNNGALVSVASGSDGQMIAVTVVVDVPRLVPFFPTSVSRSQTEPVERFVPESER